MLGTEIIQKLDRLSEKLVTGSQVSKGHLRLSVLVSDSSSVWQN